MFSGYKFSLFVTHKFSGLYLSELDYFVIVIICLLIQRVAKVLKVISLFSLYVFIAFKSPINPSCIKPSRSPPFKKNEFAIL